MTKHFAFPLLLVGLLAADVSTIHAQPTLERPTPTATATPAATAGPFTATLSNKEKGPAMTEFGANEPMVVASFKGGSLAKGDKIRVVWILESSKAQATANRQIYEYTDDAKGPNTYGFSSLNKPSSGWPLGKYRADIYVHNAKAASVKFTIK